MAVLLTTIANSVVYSHLSEIALSRGQLLLEFGDFRAELSNLILSAGVGVSVIFLQCLLTGLAIVLALLESGDVSV